MTPQRTRIVDRIDAAVDQVLDRIPGDSVLGIPLGVGKPKPFVNALYRRIKANPARRLRDPIVTEYGVADLRGQPDGEVVQRLICIADSRFQEALVKEAKAHGKLARGWEVPPAYRNNLPQALEATLHPWAGAGLLPDFPFGTDLSDDELHIVRAMKKLKPARQHPVELVEMALKSLWEDKEAPPAYLQRLGLDQAHSFKDLFIRRLFAGNL